MDMTIYRNQECEERRKRREHYDKVAKAIGVPSQFTYEQMMEFFEAVARDTGHLGNFFGYKYYHFIH